MSEYYLRVKKREVSIHAADVHPPVERRATHGVGGPENDPGIQMIGVSHCGSGAVVSSLPASSGEFLNSQVTYGDAGILPSSPEAHTNHECHPPSGPGEQNSAERVQMAFDSQNSAGLSAPNEAAESMNGLKATSAVVRRLTIDSDEFHEFIAALGPGDRVSTPFGCGSDEIVYRIVARGAAVRCCIPKLVKACGEDLDFFRRLAAVPFDLWYAIQPVDVARLRIKLLAGYRLAVQKDRVRNQLRTQRIGHGFELLDVHPAGRTYKSYAEVFKQQAAADLLVEKEITKSLEKALRADPIYTEVLSKVKGIGPAIAGYLIGCIVRADRFPGVRSLWHYAGLHVEEKDGLGRAPKPRAGADFDWNPNLKRVLLGLLADQFVKQGGPWREVYDKRKAYEMARKPDMTKGLANNRAKRYAVKEFLKWLWKEWMKREHRLLETEAA